MLNLLGLRGRLRCSILAAEENRVLCEYGVAANDPVQPLVIGPLQQIRACQPVGLAVKSLLVYTL